MKMKFSSTAIPIVAGAILAFSMSTAFAGQLTVESYDMNNGCGNSCAGTYNYWDANYNGSGDTTLDNAPLSGGTGALTDGFIETKPWYEVSNESGTGTYVGWNSAYYGDPVIIFHLAGTPTVNSLSMYVDNSDVGGVSAPATITIDGTAYTPTATPISATSEDLTVSGLSLIGPTVTVQPNRGLQEWIFVSEVQFFSSSAPEPATWAMMLLGLGLVGGGLRMARRKNDMTLSAA